MWPGDFGIKSHFQVIWWIERVKTMSKVCEVTGKRPQSGNNVSHAQNKTRRRFLPNLQKRRIWVASQARYVTMTLSTKGLRIIDKLGIDTVLERIKKRKISEK